MTLPTVNADAVDVWNTRAVLTELLVCNIDSWTASICARRQCNETNVAETQMTAIWYIQRRFTKRLNGLYNLPYDCTRRLA